MNRVFSHVLISRPLPEAKELAALLVAQGLQAIVQPAFDYLPVAVREADPDARAGIEAAGADALLIFASPRAVEHGLPQFPRGALARLRVAAIGPATAAALTAAGLPPKIAAGDGYTSEALLRVLSAERAAQAFILAAPGGREALLTGLIDRGWTARMVMVYRSEPAALDGAAVAEIEHAERLLSVWTSGNAMQSLSQRLSPVAWYAVCRGEWLVISERLQRRARAFGANRIHLSGGPGNADILTAVRDLL